MCSVRLEVKSQTEPSVQVFWIWKPASRLWLCWRCSRSLVICLGEVFCKNIYKSSFHQNHVSVLRWIEKNDNNSWLNLCLSVCACYCTDNQTMNYHDPRKYANDTHKASVRNCMNTWAKTTVTLYERYRYNFICQIHVDRQSDMKLHSSSQ